MQFGVDVCRLKAGVAVLLVINVAVIRIPGPEIVVASNAANNVVGKFPIPLQDWRTKKTWAITSSGISVGVGTMTDAEGIGLTASEAAQFGDFSAGSGTNINGPASCDTEPLRKRAKGVEPYAFPSIPTEKCVEPAAGAVKASVVVCLPDGADDDLRAVVAAWSTLPPALQAGIVAMVRAAELR